MLIIIQIYSSVFSYLGFSPIIALILLFLSIIGSSVNIPIGVVENQDEHLELEPISLFGISYRIPQIQRSNKTLIALNVGGGVIPVFISTILFIMEPIAFLYSIPTVSIASIIISRFARPVKGVGIAFPFMVLAVISVILTTIFTFNNYQIAPIVAYVTGTLGPLIGADILNLNKIPKMGAPVASIGGAGTFDGIFISGITSVLLIAIFVSS